MERVAGGVYDIEGLAHVIESDRESAWLLATRGPLSATVRRMFRSSSAARALRDVAPARQENGHGTESDQIDAEDGHRVAG
jgi:hypothetical protein